MKRIVFSLLLSLCSTIVAFAQTKSGKVIDTQTNSPVVGAVVEIKGNQTLLTDEEGIFKFRHSNTHYRIFFF